MRTSCTRVAYKISNVMVLESFHNFKAVVATGYYSTRALHILANLAQPIIPAHEPL